MKTPPKKKLPAWVLNFCLISPFCALLMLSLALAFGVTISTPALGGLVFSCHKTSQMILKL